MPRPEDSDGRCQCCEDRPSTVIDEFGAALCDVCCAEFKGYRNAERDVLLLSVQRTIREAAQTVGADEVAGWVAAALAPSLLLDELTDDCEDGV
jgi:hypothetical protein